MFKTRKASGLPDNCAGKNWAGETAFAAAMHDSLLEANINISAITSRQAHFCGRGCIYCCSQLFSISRAEAAGIANYLANNREILVAFRENMSRLDRDYPGRKALREELNSPERELEYFGKKIPCDFLACNGDCLIYPVRPLNCSAYIAYAPARICALEPKGHIPLEARKLYIDRRLWFESRSREHYPGREAQTCLWPFDILDQTQTAGFRPAEP